jgi:hypothetical protein
MNQNISDINLNPIDGIELKRHLEKNDVNPQNNINLQNDINMEMQPDIETFVRTLPDINDRIRTNIIFSVEIYKKINNFEHNYIHEYIKNYDSKKNSK